MKMKHLMILVPILFGLASGASQQPNVLFIMADDLGYNDVGYNNPLMPTHNIDHLAATNAVKLTKAYVHFRCSPLVIAGVVEISWISFHFNCRTRSAFLTGYDPYNIGTQDGVFQPYEPTGLPLRDVAGQKLTLLPEALRNIGYKTYMVGKWHLGYCKSDYLPTNRGFDHFNGFLCGGQDYYDRMTPYKADQASPAIKAFDFWKQDQVDTEDVGRYSSEVYAERTINYLTEHKNSMADSPFFMYLSFQAVHSPVEVPTGYDENCTQSWDTRKQYCGLVNAMDVAIGKVVQALKDNDQYENTIIIFSNDNGGQVDVGGSNYPLRGNKGTMWEGGCRAVSFVHSPQHFPTATVNSDLFHIVDWYATILNMAGQSVATYGNGLNQWDVLRGNQIGLRQLVIYNIGSPGSAIRLGNYKLILGNGGSKCGWYSPVDGLSANGEPIEDRVMLFDLDTDEKEEHNIAAEHPTTVRMLRQTLKKLREAPHLANVHLTPDIVNGHPDNFDGVLGWGWCST